LIDEMGGGDLMARLLPKTHGWSSLELVRHAAIACDAQQRNRIAQPDTVRTLFYWGFSIDEQLTDRLRDQKVHRDSPQAILPFSLSAEFKHDDFTAWGKSQAWQERRHHPTTKVSVETAFNARWFGNKSMARVKTLLNNFAIRFDAYPEALSVLSQWQPNNPLTRQTICHWHLQLADPMYRQFAGEYLVQRHQAGLKTLDRDIALHWVQNTVKADWSSATAIRMASALLTTATSAGLCTDTSPARTLLYPQVTDEALTYWLYLWRQSEYYVLTLH
jgi:hypothetical protein